MANSERQNDQGLKPNWELIAGTTTTVIGGDFLLTKLSGGTENLQNIGIPLFLTTIGLAFTIKALNEIIENRKK